VEPENLCETHPIYLSDVCSFFTIKYEYSIIMADLRGIPPTVGIEEVSLVPDPKLPYRLHVQPGMNCGRDAMCAASGLPDAILMNEAR
jgi:hypothetical protein